MIGEGVCEGVKVKGENIKLKGRDTLLIKGRGKLKQGEGKKCL